MLLNNLNKNTIREAFLAEKMNSGRRGEQNIAETSKLALASSNNSKPIRNVTFAVLKAIHYQTVANSFQHMPGLANHVLQ
jgi:hypothetical protein